MAKTVLVTGASSGIGKATAIYLAQKGYNVYGAARRIEKLEELKVHSIQPIALDITDDESIVACIDQILSEAGSIDILINSAGLGSYGALEDVPMGSWYHASKFAIEGLSDCLRNEVKQFGIDVIVIEPGGTKSEMTAIGAEDLMRVSGNTVYSPLAKGIGKMYAQMEKNAADPIVIAKLIEKGIAAKSPRTRYIGGTMAKPMLFIRKILSDKIFDKMLMSQMK